MKQPATLISFSCLIISLIIIGGCNIDNRPDTNAKKDDSQPTQVQYQQPTEPVDFEERFSAAREHASRGDFDQSYDILYELSEKGDTELLKLRADIALCRILVKLNRKEEAMYKRNATIMRLTKLIDTKRPDLGHVLLLAEAYAGKDELDAADKVIENSRLRFTDEKSRIRINRVASKIQERRADDIEDLEIKDNFKNKLNFICRSLVQDDQNKDAHFQLIRYYIFPKLNQDQQIWLADSAVESAKPAIVRIAIGIRESLRDRNDGATRNFRIAHETFRPTGRLIDELIDYMIKSKNLPDQKLLALANTAVDTCPETVHLLRTRATLQMATKNYQAAADDFQTFIDGVPDEFCIWSRKMLIESHKKLGNDQAVADQEKEISRILAGFSRGQQAKVMRILKTVNKKIDSNNQLQN